MICLFPYIAGVKYNKTFYNDGNLYNNIQRAAGKRKYEDVPEKAELSIIIVGTEKQNDILFKNYIKQRNNNMCVFTIHSHMPLNIIKKR